MKQTIENDANSNKIDETEDKMSIMDVVLAFFGIIMPAWDVYSDITFGIELSMPRCNYRIGKYTVPPQFSDYTGHPKTKCDK